LRNGGTAALRSYGVGADVPRLEVAGYMPGTHLEFMRSLETSFAWDRYLVVHAGIRPGVPLAAQKTEDLLWLREEFVDRPHGRGRRPGARSARAKVRQPGDRNLRGRKPRDGRRRRSRGWCHTGVLQGDARRARADQRRRGASHDDLEWALRRHGRRGHERIRG